MKEKKEDLEANVFTDINKRISQLEQQIKQLEDVSLKLIDNQTDLIAVVKGIASKLLLIDDNKDKKNEKKLHRNGELENLYR